MCEEGEPEQGPIDVEGSERLHKDLLWRQNLACIREEINGRNVIAYSALTERVVFGAIRKEKVIELYRQFHTSTSREPHGGDRRASPCEAV